MFFIKQIHDLIDVAIDNGISQYWTRTQIDNAIHQAQMSLFREILKEYPKTKIVRNELLPFQTPTNIAISGGSGPLPSDFEHEVEANNTTGGTKYPVKIMEAGMFRRRVLDPIDPPSEINAFARIYNTSGPTMEVKPSTITSVELTYIKTPTKPVYGTTGGTTAQFSYDESASTDILWSETLYDLLVERSLKPLGLGMKDGVVVRVGEPSIPKDASIT